MTEEIKEILNGLSKKASIYKMQINEGMSFNTDEYEANDLLNYITNLQKENNSLKGNIKRYAKKVKNQRVEIDGLLKQRDKIKIRHIYLKKDLKDYKQRNEKAVEYIKQTGGYIENINRFRVDLYEPLCLDLLNILKGSDEE